MITRNNKLFKKRVLLVDDKLAASAADTAGGRAVRTLVDEITSRDLNLVQALTYADGQAIAISDATIDCFLIDWNLGSNDPASHADALALLHAIRDRNLRVPIFLLADRVAKHSLTIESMGMANEFVWMLEDSAPFVVGRILVSIKNYLENLLPPFTKALVQYTATEEYSWAAPGHQGGIAFTKHPAGAIFYDYFGENLFRTDSGIERTPLGSVLDHAGPCGESEAYVAKIFGAHRSYSVLNGTSGSNRTVMGAMIGERQYAICDRNCHKSIEQGLILSGGIPVFLLPSRNRYGIVGPIHPDQFDPKSISQKIKKHALKTEAAPDPKAAAPTYAVVTNCTYDGMCYHATEVQALLEKTVDRIHFDEAWYAYARFNPLYRERHAMSGDPADHPKNGPTVFATHSTHKMLAALSQSSFIHIRNGRRPVDHSRFNESYMMQATTSPLYAMYASNEIGAAIMDGPGGKALTQDVINEAVDFRQGLARAHRTFAKQKDWFFQPWNAPEVRDPKTKKRIAFADAPRELLATDPECWVLHPGEKWHGFEGLTDGWCLLDPVKAGIVCPGMGDDGNLEKNGIPAAIVSSYLYRHGIIPSRTTDFMVLFLFSIGVTKGKWATLVNTLLNFKKDYDNNTSLELTLPDLVKTAPNRYAGMGLKDLADEVFAHMKTNRMDHWQAQAFGNLPKPIMRPRDAYLKLNADQAELLPLDQWTGRTSAVGIIPYPPGIPIIMPGENFGPKDSPWITYVRTIQEWGQKFPGFEKEVEGAVLKDGIYHAWCVKE